MACCRQARNFTTNIPKILDLKSSSEQIFSENCRWVPLCICSPSRRLRSSTSIQLKDHSRRSKKTLGDQAFSKASAKIWNSLPQSLQSQQTFNTFKSLLKTHYFREVFNLWFLFSVSYSIYPHILWLIKNCK